MKGLEMRITVNEVRATAQTRTPPPEPDGSQRTIVEFARALIRSRQNVSPKRLDAPAPTEMELETLFEAAAAAPDHGQLTPWRFVIIPQNKRAVLAEVFALCLVDRHPGATLADIEAAREKAYRAPLVMAAIARVGPPEEGIAKLERVVSLGCAIQNMLLTANALGYGTGLTSGHAMKSPRMKALMGLSAFEHAVCFVNIGTVTKHKPPRRRPAPDAFVSTL